MYPITPQNVHDIIARVQRRSFLANPFYLIANCQYEDRGGDAIVYVDQDVLAFPCANPAHMAHRKVWCFASEVDRLRAARLDVRSVQPDATEYFYATQQFIDLPGSTFKKLRQEVHRFTTRYDFRVHREFPIAEVMAFVERWFAIASAKKRDALLDTLRAEHRATMFALERLHTVSRAQALYVTVDQRLVGFSIFAALYPDFWVSVFQKIDPAYAGLGVFLYQEKCRAMAAYATFSTGDDAMDPALVMHKQQLHPSTTEEHALVTLGPWVPRVADAVPAVRIAQSLTIIRAIP